MKKIIHWLDNYFERTVCVALLMAITGFTFLNVVMRYIFHNAISWATEGTLFAFAWFVWFAISYGFVAGSHVNVTVLSNLLPKKGRKGLSIFCYIVMLIGFIYLAYWGYQLITDPSVLGKYGLLLKYPKWTLYLSAPVGATLSTFRVAQCLVKIIIGHSDAPAGSQEV